MAHTNLEVLAYEETPIGMIGLRRRELLAVPGTIVTEITIDHQMLMSSYHTASEIALSSRALELHRGEGLRVLVGGLGLGYTADAVLQSPRVAHCEVIEFLPQVIDWMREGLVPLSESMNADERLQIVQADVYALLAADPKQHFDLILVDVDHSPDERLGEDNEGFYSEKGLKAAKRHLAPGGMLGIWSYAECSPFLDALRSAFSEVVVEPVTFQNRFEDAEETNWIFLARDV